MIPGRGVKQAVLGRSVWDAEALRDVVRDYVVETLASPEAVLVIDETGFLKQGRASCGVARQYTGSAGKITNSLMFGVNDAERSCPIPARARWRDVEHCAAQEAEPLRRRLSRL